MKRSDKEAIDSWDYDGKEFYVITGGTRQMYVVPDDVRDEIKGACPGLLLEWDISGPILIKARSEGRLGPARDSPA